MTHTDKHTHSLSSVAHTDSWTPSVCLMLSQHSPSPTLALCLVSGVCERHCLYQSSLLEHECCWISSYTGLNTEEHQCLVFGSGKRRRGWSGETSGGASRGLSKSGEGIMCVYLGGRQTRLNRASGRQIRRSVFIRRASEKSTLSSGKTHNHGNKWHFSWGLSVFKKRTKKQDPNQTELTGLISSLLSRFRYRSKA